MSPPRFRGRGRMKKLQTHTPEVGASRVNLKPSASDTQTLSKSPVASLKEAAMPLTRYGLGDGEKTPMKLEDPVYVPLGCGDADSDTPTFSDNELHRESPAKGRRAGDKVAQQLYSAADRQKEKLKPSSAYTNGRSKQFEDYDSSDHSTSSHEQLSRSKGARRHKALDMSMKQQNEYERRAGRVRRDIIAVMEEDYSDTKQERLENLILPKKSVLEGLPGSKEFVIFLDVIVTKFVENYDSFLNDALFYLQQYQEEEMFVHSFGDVLMKNADKYVVASTGTTQHPQLFAKTIAQIWLYLGQWNYRSAEVVTACLRKLMDKWAMPQIHQVCVDMQQVYARCLLHLFTVAGPQLLSVFKADFTAIIQSLKQRLLASDTSSEVREYYLSIVLLYHEWQVKLLPTALPTKSCGVQMAPSMRNQAIQTDTIDTPATVIHTAHRDPTDPYRRVKTMLKELHMEDLWSIFEENAVRDSTIHQSDFTDVKDLLKEIGLKAGHVLEIKSYLSNPSRTPSPSASAVEVAAPQYVSPVLVSPQTYEETFKRLNNQLMHDQNSLSCVPAYSTTAGVSSAASGSSSHISADTAKPREKYQPPFRRDGVDKTISDTVQVVDDAATAQQFYSGSKAFIPPPPGFTPLPSAWATDSKKAVEESRADSDTNWRKKSTQTNGNTGRGNTNNGKMTVLGKCQKSKSEVEPAADKPYKKILNETQCFLDHSLKKDSLKLSNPDLSLHATIPTYFSEQDFPALSAVGGKEKTVRGKSASPVVSSTGTSSPLHMIPLTTARKQESTTIPPARKSFPVFCAVCNSQEHETHKCTQKTERYANC